MITKKGKTTSFEFTVKAKENLDAFRNSTGLTQPEIMNRILESVDIEFVTDKCNDLIESRRQKLASAEEHSALITRLAALPSDKLERLLAQAESGD